MYEQYYGLRERPFDLSPNPRFLFLSNRHREALTHLRYGLSGRPGLTVLIGEAGTGKTTLVKAALQSANGSSARDRPPVQSDAHARPSSIEYLAAGFGFSPDAPVVEDALPSASWSTPWRARAREHAVLALIVDEAQSLPHELLEEIRLLTNVETRAGQVAGGGAGRPAGAGRSPERLGAAAVEAADRAAVRARAARYAGDRRLHCGARPRGGRQCASCSSRATP